MSDRRYSISRVSTAEACTKKWWFESVIEMPLPEKRGTAFGSVTHRCIERALLGEDPFPLGWAHDVDYHEAEQIRELIRLGLEGGIISPLPQQEIEHEFGFTLPDQLGEFTGRIDVLYQHGVHDHKCVLGTTEVFDHLRGRRATIQELADSGQDFEISCLDEATGKIKVAQAQAFPSGTKSCVRVDLSGGHKIEVSSDHPVFTQRGWVKAFELTTDDMMVGPRTIAPPARFTEMSVDDAAMLGYLLADGGCTNARTLLFTNMTPSVIEDFHEVAGRLGWDVKERIAPGVKSKAGHWAINSGGITRNFGEGGYGEWRDRWDLYGKATTKRLHPDLYGMSDECIKIFLNRFWACDGHISVPTKRIVITLANEDMIRDLRFLLLRLGVFGDVCEARTTWTHKGERRHSKAWTLTISNGPQIKNFLATVGAPLGKEEACARLRVARESVDVGGRDPIPFGRPECKELFKETGIPHLRETLACGTDSLISRKQFADWAGAAGYSGKFAWLATSDLRWVRVKEITTIGEHPVYDVSVPGVGNWVGNFLVTHNTAKNDRYILNKEKLANDLQMLCYGRVYFMRHPEATTCELAHNQFIRSVTYKQDGQKRQRPEARRVPITVTREAVETVWNDRIMPIISRMAEQLSRKETEWRQVPGPHAIGACDAYGGCPFQGICTGMETPEQMRARMQQQVSTAAPAAPPSPPKAMPPSRFAALAGSPVSTPAPTPPSPSPAPVAAKAPAVPPPVAAPAPAERAVAAMSETGALVTVVDADAPWELARAPWGARECTNEACRGRGYKDDGKSCIPCSKLWKKARGTNPSDVFSTFYDNSTFRLSWIDPETKRVYAISIAKGAAQRPEAAVAQNTTQVVPIATVPAQPVQAAPLQEAAASLGVPVASLAAEVRASIALDRNETQVVAQQPAAPSAPSPAPSSSPAKVVGPQAAQQAPPVTPERKPLTLKNAAERIEAAMGPVRPTFPIRMLVIGVPPLVRDGSVVLDLELLFVKMKQTIGAANPTGAKAFEELDTWRRKDALSGLAGRYAAEEMGNVDVAFAPHGSTDLKAFVDALRPFAAVVVDTGKI